MRKGQIVILVILAMILGLLLGMCIRLEKLVPDVSRPPVQNTTDAIIHPEYNDDDTGSSTTADDTTSASEDPTTESTEADVQWDTDEF